MVVFDGYGELEKYRRTELIHRCDAPMEYHTMGGQQDLEHEKGLVDAIFSVLKQGKEQLARHNLLDVRRVSSLSCSSRFLPRSGRGRGRPYRHAESFMPL